MTSGSSSAGSTGASRHRIARRQRLSGPRQAPRQEPHAPQTLTRGNPAHPGAARGQPRPSQRAGARGKRHPPPEGLSGTQGDLPPSPPTPRLARSPARRPLQPRPQRLGVTFAGGLIVTDARQRALADGPMAHRRSLAFGSGLPGHRRPAPNMFGHGAFVFAPGLPAT